MLLPLTQNMAKNASDFYEGGSMLICTFQSIKSMVNLISIKLRLILEVFPSYTNVLVASLWECLNAGGISYRIASAISEDHFYHRDDMHGSPSTAITLSILAGSRCPLFSYISSGLYRNARP